MTLGMFIYPFIFTIIGLLLQISFGGTKTLTLTPDHYQGSSFILQSDLNPSPAAEAYSKLFSENLVRLNSSLQDYILQDRPNSVIAAAITQQNLTAFFNNEAYHSAPISVNLLYNAILKSSCSDCAIEVVNAPVEKKDKKNPDDKELDPNIILFVSRVGMIFSIFVPMFIIFYVKERVCRSKLLQTVCGIDLTVYWLASYLYDLCLFIIFILLFLMTIVIDQTEFWSTWSALFDLYILLMAFSFAVLPMIYVVSNIFRVPSSGVSWTLFFFLITGNNFLGKKQPFWIFKN